MLTVQIIFWLLNVCAKPLIAFFILAEETFTFLTVIKLRYFSSILGCLDFKMLLLGDLVNDKGLITFNFYSEELLEALKVLGNNYCLELLELLPSRFFIILFLKLFSFYTVSTGNPLDLRCYPLGLVPNMASSFWSGCLGTLGILIRRSTVALEDLTGILGDDTWVAIGVTNLLANSLTF